MVPQHLFKKVDIYQLRGWLDLDRLQELAREGSGLQRKVPIESGEPEMKWLCLNREDTQPYDGKD
jgi:hypothetical protein